MTLSNMQRTVALGTEFWNDSCDVRELEAAVAHGAAGATSNPVIVHQVVEADPATWTPVVDALLEAHPEASETDIAWYLIEAMARRGAAVLRPVYDATAGRTGFLSVQVNPQFYRDAARMVEHGRHLAALAPNLAIKVPATRAGIAAMEELTAAGVRINATVCFSVAQAVAAAEAVERGAAAAIAARRDVTTLRPTITLMVGRLDDHLQRAQERERINVDPGHAHWAGIAVFKRTQALFRARGYRSLLLAAAYRSVLHWSELIGEHVVLTMPYRWWTQFNAAALTPERRLDRPVAAHIVDSLGAHFADFRRAEDENGLMPAEFDGFGPTVHTLQQFLGGAQRLAEWVRSRMLRA
jgi:transaldolase